MRVAHSSSCCKKPCPWKQTSPSITEGRHFLVDRDENPPKENRRKRTWLGRIWGRFSLMKSRACAAVHWRAFIRWAITKDAERLQQAADRDSAGQDTQGRGCSVAGAWHWSQTSARICSEPGLGHLPCGSALRNKTHTHTKKSTQQSKRGVLCVGEERRKKELKASNQ